ncbi:MAG: type I 3-dehydroquinate dehydratase [Nitrososphaera sp.]|uniref:type I 3-dehydroquinate dehydratase n=1 Tax=Nitrososphaera sp. TaxID=1971748 RepID=UPI00185B63BE|nr:type I 3-dehydroquinate dehydratase [Nitrososphaera sp.]NWG37212.1 type I 3-dehydroquinate dehydratase [Nitrososphaera sp.]
MAKICVTIAEESVGKVKEQMKKAFEAGADFVEVRFDFLKPGEVMAAVDIIGEDRGRCVFTLRSVAQGGKFSGTEEERMRLLRKLAEAKPMLVDVELDTLKVNDNLADYLELASIPTLVSWHDFEKTPPNEELSSILTEMRIFSTYVKVVTTAKSVDDSLRLMALYEGALGLHPIIFAMGEAGVLTRVMSALYGAPYTYAALDRAVAPGQLTLAQMRKLYDGIKGNRS